MLVIAAAAACLLLFAWFNNTGSLLFTGSLINKTVGDDIKEVGTISV